MSDAEMKRMLPWLTVSVVAALACGVAAAAPAVGRASPALCASVAPRLAAPSGGPSGSLVRAGARSLLLCRYNGLNPAATARRLRSSRQVTAHREIAALVAELNALPSLPKLVNCPFDDGGEIVATFAYKNGDMVVLVGLTGCRVVRGSRPPVRTAGSPGGQRLLADLAALVP
jgi:hypothetical protein